MVLAFKLCCWRSGTLFKEAAISYDFHLFSSSPESEKMPTNDN